MQALSAAKSGLLRSAPPQSPPRLSLHFLRSTIQPSNSQISAMRQQLRAAMPDSGEDVIDASLKHALHQLVSNPVWLSETHQVNIVTAGRVIHYSIKSLDKQPILSRADLVDIAHHFCRSKRDVCCELYPAEDRVVDTANQYHLWQMPMPRGLSPSVHEALSKPEHQVPLDGGHFLTHIPLGTERDWRLVQAAKNDLLGAATEAIDLMLPITRERGPVLLVFPSGVAAPIGWQSGLRIDATHNAAWQQRTFTGQTSA